MSASVAIRTVSNDAQIGGDSNAASLELIAAVSRRLQSQIEIIQLGKAVAAVDTSTVMGQMSCADRAETVTALDACKQKLTDASQQTQLEEYYSWQLVRMTLSQVQGPLEPNLQAALPSLVDHLTAEEVSTKLDYTHELQYLKELHQANYKLEGVAERVSASHPDLKLIP